VYTKKTFGLLIVAVLLVFSANAQVNKQQKFLRINPNICTVIGNISSEQENLLSDVLLTVIDNDTHDFIGNYSPEISTGIYSINLLKAHKYQIIVECQDYYAYLVEIMIKADSEKEISMNIIIPDSYRKSFTIEFNALNFEEDNINTLSLIANLMTEYPDMKIRLVYEDDIISGHLADSIFLRFNTMGLFSDRVLGSRIAAGKPEEYIVDLIIKHNIYPEEIEKDVVEEDLLDDELLEERDKNNIEIKKDSILIIEDEIGDPVFTIQLAASKKPFKPGHFQGLTNVKVYHGKDGYYRYTSGQFVTKRAATQHLANLKAKGHSQAYIREIKEYIE